MMTSNKEFVERNNIGIILTFCQQLLFRRKNSFSLELFLSNLLLLLEFSTVLHIIKLFDKGN